MQRNVIEQRIGELSTGFRLTTGVGVARLEGVR